MREKIALGTISLFVMGVVFSVPAITVAQATTSHGMLTASTDGGVTFTDIAQQAGINYQHVPSETFAVVQATREQSLLSPVTVFDVISGPLKPHGHPGVAIFDFDKDGDRNRSSPGREFLAPLTPSSQYSLTTSNPRRPASSRRSRSCISTD